MTRGDGFFVCLRCQKIVADPAAAPAPHDAVPGSGLDALPFPVAHPLAHAEDPGLCGSASVRFDNLLFAASQAIRLCGLLMLADYLRTEVVCRELATQIRRIRRPCWQEWRDLARVLAKFWLGHYPGSLPGRQCVFPWLPGAWMEVDSTDPKASRWADALRQLPGNEGPARSVVDALHFARNEVHHRRATVSSQVEKEYAERLRTLFPLVREAAQLLFPADGVTLFRRTGVAPPEMVALLGPHLDFTFVARRIPKAWIPAFSTGEVVAASKESRLALYPLVVPLDDAAHAVAVGGAGQLEPAGLCDGVLQKQMFLLGVRTAHVRADLVGPFVDAIRSKQADLGLDRGETKAWVMASWSAAEARATLEELRGRKYFPAFYVERSGVDDRVRRVLDRGGRALLVLGNAGSGKSSMLSRLVDGLTSATIPAGGKGKKRKGDSLHEYLARSEGQDAVIFLTGRAAYAGDAGATGDRLLCEAVLRQAGIRAGEFTSLAELFDRLGESTAADPVQGRRVYVVLDALNEAERFTDLVGALDAVLPLVARHPWLRLAFSMRTGAYESLVRRRQNAWSAGGSVFEHERHLASFTDGVDGKPVPYLDVRPFRDAESAAAYEKRCALFPGRCCRVPWGQLSEGLRDLLRSPLRLHLFHETYAGREVAPVDLDEDALFGAYVAHLGAGMAGLGPFLARLGALMYERRMPVLPLA
ncbi:MAG: hypothetical protein RLZZ253_2880, partial [Verrucomicrobiota bacterium]